MFFLLLLMWFHSSPRLLLTMAALVLQGLGSARLVDLRACGSCCWSTAASVRWRCVLLDPPLLYVYHGCLCFSLGECLYYFYLGCFSFRIYISWLFSPPRYITYVQFFSLYLLTGSVISKIQVSLLSFWASVTWSNEQMCDVPCLQERASVSCFGPCLFLYGQ